MAVDRVGWHARNLIYMQRSTHNHESEGKKNYLGWMLYSVYAVLLVYAVLGLYWTRCTLYSVYAVLSVNS